MNKFMVRAALKALGVSLFVIILSRLDWRVLLSTLFTGELSGLLFLGVSLALLFPLLIIKVFRWRLILRNLGIEISQSDGMKYYIIGLFAGAATPGQLGDFVKTIYLSKKGFPGGAAFFGVLYDRSFDIIALAIVLFMGLAFLSGQTVTSPVIIISAVFILILLSLFLWSRTFRNFIAVDLFKYLLPGGIKKRFKQLDVTFDVIKYQLKPKVMLASLFLTLAAYGVIFYRYYLLLAVLKLNIPFPVWFGGVALASFVVLIPISVSGVGTRDAVLIAVFSTVGVEPEKAVAFSLLILLLMVFNGIIGLVAWMKNPLIPKKSLEI